MYTSDELATLNYWKNELKQYRYLQKLERELSEQYIELVHASVAPNAPKYDGMPHNQSNPIATTRWTILDEQKAITVEKHKAVVQRISAITSLLLALDVDDRAIIKRLYVSQSTTIDTLAMEYSYTVKQMRTRIDVSLMLAIEKKLKKGMMP